MLLPFATFRTKINPRIRLFESSPMLSARKLIIFFLALSAIHFLALPGHAQDGVPSGFRQRVISSASELDYPPFSVVGDDGSADGFSVELLKVVCRAVGLDVTFKVGPWNEIKQELTEGRLDALPLVSYSKERDKELDFTAPYLRMHGTIFVRKGEKSIHGESDLKDREVLVMRGDTAHEYALRMRLSDRLILTASFEEALKKLAAGKHDAVIMQHLVGLQLIKKLGLSNLVSVRSFQEASLKPAARPLSEFEQKFCMAVKEGDKELLGLLNEGLSIVIANGVYNELYDKWFGPILPGPSVSLSTMLKYLLLTLAPILLAGGIFGIWYLKREVAGQTKKLKAQIAVSEKTGEALKVSKAHLRTLIDTLPDLIWLKDQKGRYLSCNTRFESFFGAKEKEIIGKTDYDFVEKDLADHFRKHDNMAVASGKPIRNEETIAFSDDGHQETLETIKTPMFNSDGRLTGVLGIGRDITERKRAESALRESEEKFRLTFNSSPDAVNINRLRDGLYVDTNEGFTQLTGFTREDVAGKTSLDIDIWHDPQDRSKLVLELQKNGFYDNLEAQFRRKDGSLTTALMSARVISLNGEPHIISITRDISERKQTEEEREITLRLLQALHRENDLYELIRDVTELMQNWSGCEAVGIRLQENEDYPYFETRGFPAEFVDAESRLCALDMKGELIRDSNGDPRLECMCGNIIRGNFDSDLPFFTENGSFWTNSTTDLLAGTTEDERRAPTRNRCHGQGYESVALIPLHAGKKRLGLLQFNDPRRDQFDERKIALFERLGSSLAIGLSQRMTALALQESEEKYRSMMEAMDDATYICSSDFHIEYMNPAMIKMVGRDATGELCHQVVHGRDEKCPNCIHEKVMKGETIPTEAFFADRGRTYHVSNSPVFHTDGSVSKLTVYRDVTEIKTMEKRILQTQKMESIGALAGGIAHDFNNILFPIVGLSEMMMEDLPAGSFEQENAAEIYKSARRAVDLVKQILSFSRQAEQKKMPVRVQQVLKEAGKLMRSTIPSNIKINLELQSDCGLVLADPTQVHQIAMNLITNAYHAVEKSGGEIWVRLKGGEPGEDELIGTALTPGKYAVLSVADTGCGIDPTLLGKIFEPYFTTKEQGKGTGLGLSVVYGLVKDHGGEIRVQSEIDRGSTIFVYLPIIDRRPDEDASDRETIAHELGTERILLVDDEEPIAKLGKQVLERLGYTVATRTSSLEALEAFRTNPDAYDLILTDMTMPNMTGDRLTAELLSIRPELPVVICTGFSEQMNPKKAEAIGAKGLLMKPIIRADMASMVRRVLDDSKRSEGD